MTCGDIIIMSTERDNFSDKGREALWRLVVGVCHNGCLMVCVSKY